MASHDLEVGVIVDLDVDGGSIARGRERDRSTWTNIREETVSVPRCLPLRSTPSAIVVDEWRGKQRTTSKIP